MHVQQLGHAVIKVRDMQRAEAFYHGVLGFPIAARTPNGSMTFFTLGNHHDLALIEVGADAPDAPRQAPGLFHLAFKIGDSLDDLRAAKAELEAAGITIDGVTDHTVSQALYLRDPDGNGVELYVDTSDVWKHEPARVAESAPLNL